MILWFSVEIFVFFTFFHIFTFFFFKDIFGSEEIILKINQTLNCSNRLEKALHKGTRATVDYWNYERRFITDHFHFFQEMLNHGESLCWLTGPIYFNGFPWNLISVGMSGCLSFSGKIGFEFLMSLFLSLALISFQKTWDACSSALFRSKLHKWVWGGFVLF